MPNDTSSFYYVLTNQDLYVRALAQDLAGRWMFNFISAPEILFSADKRGLASSSLTKVSGEELQSKYAKRRIALGDEVGPVQLRCEVADPESRQLADGKLSLVRVHPVEVSPPFQVAYIHRENTKSYKVLFGSGSFGDSMNDTRVAEVRFFSEKRYELAPLREGFLRFTISDNKTYRGAKASAVLLVSDVIAIELTGGGDI